MKLLNKLKSDLLITAVESGIGYWATRLTISDSETGAPLDYQDESLFTRVGDWTLMVKDIEDGMIYTNTRQGFSEATSKMPDHHLVNLMNDNWDAETADVWFQCAVLGEITFG